MKSKFNDGFERSGSMQKIGILMTTMNKRMSIYVQHSFYGSGNFDVYAGFDGEEPEK